MTGANYMGGRRNAAKARSKDKTGRIQKDFFGRRRLNILSKGLAAAPRSRDVISGGSVSVTRASIELGHAKKATAPQEETVSILGKRKRDPTNIQTSSSSPRSKRSAQTASSSTKSTKSRLLQELDFIEPYAAMSCILAMNDLAGLRPSPRKRKRLDSSSRSPSPVSSCGDDSVVNEEEDQIMEYESVSGSCHQSSISSGSGNPSGSRITRQYQQSDGLLLQDVLETEHMRKVDYDRDRSSHCTSSTKAFRGAQVFTSRRCSSVSLLAQVSSASREDEQSSFISVYASQERSAHQSPRSDGRAMSFKNDVPARSNAGAQPIDPDIEIQREEICTNILDYSDPWEQIGIIMGLQENRNSQMVFTSQEECNTAEDEQDIEKPAVPESDLPPSDIMDDSLDDTLYSPSSLPIAESSESTRVCLKPTVAFPQVDPENLWDVDFEDWAIGPKESQIDDAALPSTHDILAVDGKVLNGSALIESGDAQGRHPSQEEQQYPPTKSDAAGSHAYPVEDARRSVAEDSPVYPSATLKSDASRSPRTAMDRGPCVVDCAMESEDVLAIPELLACNGVYQGPCLLSQDSEPE